MSLFVRRWDPSFPRRKSSPDGSLSNMANLAKTKKIDVWVEATPSGKVFGLHGRHKGSALCPYSLRYPFQKSDSLSMHIESDPLFENLYQAAKVSTFTPRHNQMLNGRSVLVRDMKKFFGDGSARRIADITGREALEANYTVIQRMLRADAQPIRSQFPKHMRSNIIGSIDWDNLDGSLLSYSEARKQYGKLFQESMENSNTAVDLLGKLAEALSQGKRIVIAETDGPDLSLRQKYIEKGVEYFDEDGLMLVTPKAFSVVSSDLSKCFGHCWHVARALLNLPSDFNTFPLKEISIADSLSEAMLAHRVFTEMKASRAKATRNQKRSQEATNHASDKKCRRA